MMLILEILLRLKSKQGKIAAAFLHADLAEVEKWSMLKCLWDPEKRVNGISKRKLSIE